MEYFMPKIMCHAKRNQCWNPSPMLYKLNSKFATKNYVGLQKQNKTWPIYCNLAKKLKTFCLFKT